MLNKNSALDFTQQHRLEAEVNIEDLQFAFQLAAVAFGIEPERIEWGVPLAQLRPKLPLIVRVLTRYPIASFLDSLISLWCEDVTSRDRHCGQLTLGDLLDIIADWRSAIGLGDSPWFEAEKADFYKIATRDKEIGVNEPANNERDIVEKCGGLNTSRLGKIRYSPQLDIHSLVLLLTLSAREWLDHDEYRARFYPNSKLDTVVLIALFDEVPAMSRRLGIRGLLRPQDQVAADPDDVGDILGQVWATLVNYTQYDIREDQEWPEKLGSDDPLLNYWSLHYLIVFLEENIISRV